MSAPSRPQQTAIGQLRVLSSAPRPPTTPDEARAAVAWWREAAARFDAVEKAPTAP